MEDARPSYILFFIGLLPFIMAIGNSMFIPLLPVMQLDMGLTTVEGGWLLTSFSIPAALLVPLGGILSDRYGRKRIALVALPLIIIGCMISAFAGIMGNAAGAFELMMFGRVLQGIGAGSLTPLAMAFITDLFEGEQRVRALGTVEVFNGAGKVISPIVGGVILAFSWYYSFVFYLAISLFAFVGIVIFIRLKKAPLKAKEKNFKKWQRLKALFINHWRWLTPIFAFGLIGMFLLFGYLFYFSYLLEISADFSSFLNGVLLAFPLLMLTILSYVTARILRGNENNYKRAFIYGGLTMTFGSVMMIIQSLIHWFVISMTIYAIGFGIVLPAANAALASIVSEKERGTVFSFYSMLRFLGVALGPLCFGFWISNVEQMMFTALFFVTFNVVILLFSWKCFPVGKECLVTDYSRI
ncbi:MFS transporter [Halalkalibacter alkaliphilus]|uniref:MFS transporter n=1 Tax=Halalkalibacter alkaliphilus TaxID=2917993 RepID=A0A9X2CS37_9BACI|nr:MFS transporter [Halalkalibacter alkaliphilus]MCL7747206.1 MFS transporter [Halalkalibacter alkaliphilus]